MLPLKFFEKFKDLLSMGDTITVIASYGNEIKDIIINRGLILSPLKNGSIFNVISKENQKLKLKPQLQMRVFRDLKRCCSKIQSHMLVSSAEKGKLETVTKRNYDKRIEIYDKMLKLYPDISDKIKNYSKEDEEMYSVLCKVLDFLSRITNTNTNKKPRRENVSQIQTWEQFHLLIIILKHLKPNFDCEVWNWGLFFKEFTPALESSEVEVINSKEDFVVNVLKRIGISLKKEQTVSDNSKESTTISLFDNVFELLSSANTTEDASKLNQVKWRCVLQLLDYSEWSVFTILGKDGKTGQLEVLSSPIRPSNIPPYVLKLESWARKDSLDFIRSFCDENSIAEVIVGDYELDEYFVRVLSGFKARGVCIKLDLRIGNDNRQDETCESQSSLELRVDSEMNKITKNKICINVKGENPQDIMLSEEYLKCLRALEAVERRGSDLKFYLNSNDEMINVIKAAKDKNGKLGTFNTKLNLSEYVAEILDTSNSLKFVYLKHDNSIKFSFPPKNIAGKSPRQLDVLVDCNVDDLFNWVFKWRFVHVFFMGRSIETKELYLKFKEKLDSKGIVYSVIDGMFTIIITEIEIDDKFQAMCLESFN